MTWLGVPALILLLILTPIVVIRAVTRTMRDMRRVRNVIRKGRGLCPHCKYDLRNNMSGVCPECGANVPDVLLRDAGPAESDLNTLSGLHRAEEGCTSAPKKSRALVGKMPRMRRRLFTILAALSLVLCLATVVLWVRSYWSADVVRCTTNSFEPSSGAQWSACNINRVVTWGRGELKLEYTRREWTLPPFGLPAQLRDTAGTRLAFAANPPEDPMEWEDTRGRAPWHDFYFNRNSLGSAIVTSETVAAVPIWSLAAFLATLPVVWLVRSVLRRRPFAGQCVQCRYDLRATPGRCPECGAVPHGFRIKGQ